MISPDATVINSKIGTDTKVYSQAEIKNSSLDNNVIVGNQAIIIGSTLESNISINRQNYILKSKIGKYTYTGIGTSIRSAEVGRFCSLAWNVSIGGGNHEFNNVTTSPLWRFLMLDEGNVNHETNKELKKRYNEFGSCIVGNDVWVATNAVILRGVKVGNGVIIGAGAVVTKDIAPYSIVAGVPAKKIKMRFDDKIIDALEEIQWWNWPAEVIRKNLDLIYSTKVDETVIRQLKEIAKTI